MNDNIKKFNDFCLKYDLYENSVEEKIVLYLKNIFLTPFSLEFYT